MPSIDPPFFSLNAVHIFVIYMATISLKCTLTSQHKFCCQSYNAHCHSFKAQAFPRKCFCWVGKNRIQQPHWLYKSSILGRRIKKKQQTKTSIVWHMDNYKIKFSEGFTIGENLKFIASSTEPLSYWLADFTVVNCMLMS